MSAMSDWLAQLKNEPWYAAVQSTFAAKSIADPLWQSTLYVEDSSLNPATSVVDSNGALSTGLFQLNADGIGAGQSTATLTDPVQNAILAAKAMAARIALEGTGSASLPTQLQTIERAGWNGGLAQDPKRQQALSDVTAASGGNGLTDPNQDDNPVKKWIYEHTPVGTLENAINNPVQTIVGALSGGSTSGPDPIGLKAAAATANTIAAEALIGAVFLAIVAGGFAIAAQPGGGE